MKNLLIFLTLCPFVFFSSKAQVLIAKWTFPTGTTTDSLPDGGITANLNKAFKSAGTSAIDFSKNGLTTKAAQATGWDNGNGTKYWYIMISTKDYDSINLSSKQQSGGATAGPRDYKLQYRLGNNGLWTDITKGAVSVLLKVMNDWTTGAVNDLFLPSVCDDQDSVFIRWLVNSDTNSLGAVTAANGISKIDDIYFYGKAIKTTNICNMTSSREVIVYPNPCRGNLNISSTQMIQSINICDLQGKMIISESGSGKTEYSKNLNLSKGIYLLNVSLKGENQTVKLKILSE
jgi:hypothetical protein